MRNHSVITFNYSALSDVRCIVHGKSLQNVASFLGFHTGGARVPLADPLQEQPDDQKYIALLLTEP